jgi:VWFA-related protein
VKVGFVFVLLATRAAAQAPNPGQPSDPPVFRVGTRLVQVDVVVRDKNGPVTGLTRDDFSVLDNGKAQAIAVFSVRSVENAAPKREPLPPGVVSNRLQSRTGEPVAATVLLFDYLNTEAPDQAWVRQKAMDYLRVSDPREQIALYTLGRTIRAVQTFTDDRDLLVSAVARTLPEQSAHLGVTELTKDLPRTGDRTADAMIRNSAAAAAAMSNRRRADGTAAALANIAKHLAGLPGRKKLVWISASFPLSVIEMQERNGQELMEVQNYSRQVDLATRELNDANVAVYPVDARGLTQEGLLLPGIDSMNRIAVNTGGVANYGSNDLAGAIHRALRDTDLTYTLGFYPSEEKLDGAFHRIAVRLARSGVEVRYRKGYVATQPQKASPQQRRVTLNQWVREPLDANELAIWARAAPVPERTGFYRVEVGIDPSGLQLQQRNGRWTGSIDLAIVPDTGGNLRGLHQTIRLDLTESRLREAISSGLVFRNMVQVTGKNGKPLADKLHVVLQDQATAAAGSVRIPLAVN